MRDIKFRGWNVKTKTMLDLKAITPLAMDSKLECDGLFLPFTDEVILMQYTGLPDKNGVEIYEDDIYKDAHGIVYLVQMKVDGWGLFPVKKDSPVRSLYWRNVYIHDAGAVIGNRHQNPELLEDK